MKQGQTSQVNRKNAGFTLIELIVVMVIMAIMLTFTAMGIFAWQDWSRMQQENANAEEIFMAAQNQLNEYAMSGALEREVLEKITNADGTYNVTQLIGSGPANTTEGYVNVSNIKNSDGEHYSWDELWSTAKGKVGTEKEKYQGTIVSLSVSPTTGAEESYYDRFLRGDKELPKDKKLLFQLITAYIYDKSILNNASILIEFSPESAQVFAVCYSDQAGAFTYNNDGVNVLDRSDAKRSELMMGYYGVDTLAKAIKGRTRSDFEIKAGSFELRNEEMLYAVYCPENQGDIFSPSSKTNFVLNVYNPDVGPYQKVMDLRFTIEGRFLPGFGIKSAQGTAAKKATATFYQETTDQPLEDAEGKPIEKEFRVPIWLEWSSKGERVICIALDAVDIQAQTVALAEATGLTSEGMADAETAFDQTYSFYRFGLDVDRVYLGMQFETDKQEVMPGETFSCAKGGKEENKEGEYVTFASVNRNETAKQATYEITNGRHFYNIRYVEDYAIEIAKAIDEATLPSDPQVGDLLNNRDLHAKYSRSFVLKSDIDWHRFVDYQYRGANVGNNYFLNSYDQNGFEVKEEGKQPRYVKSGVQIITTDTESAEFPSFRRINAGDSFVQDFSALDAEEDAEKESYTISNLTITTDANELYGIYGYKAMKTNLDSKLEGEGYTDKSRKESYDQLSFARAKGGRPTGLFAVNFGTIKNLTLDRHKVFGSYKVGGFIGENMGEVSGLTLRNTENNAGSMDGAEKALVEGKVLGHHLVVPYFFYGNLDKDTDTRYYAIAYNETTDGSKLKAFIEDTLYAENTSFVVGIHDVGGIIGYQKYKVSIADSETRNSQINEKLTNEAPISGQMYLGGIVGRAIVNYERENETPDYTDHYFDMDNDDIPAMQISTKVSGDDVSEQTELVSRVALTNITFDQNVNHGRVQALPVYDGTKNDKIGNVRVAYYAGGITGMACDNANNVPEVPDEIGIEFSKCISYWTYTDTEVDKLFPAHGEGEAPNADKLREEMRVIFCGGLTGYARFAKFYRCSTVPENDALESDEHPYVFGKNYVGGFAGGAERCEFVNEKDNGEEIKTENAINVVGTFAVGGIAGFIGRPYQYQNKVNTLKTYQFKPETDTIQNPANGNKANDRTNSMLLNTGLTYAIAVKNAREDHVEEKSAFCGGICGRNAETIENADSLLSEYAKNQMIKIVDWANEDKNCLGDYVGGLVGYNSWRINYSEGSRSEVNSVVLGENNVGGGVGRTHCEENESTTRRYSVRNVYLVDSTSTVNTSELNDFYGSFIYGTDQFTGGICGYIERGGVLNNNPVIGSFYVKGKDYVGGFAGAYIGGNYSVNAQMAGELSAGTGRQIVHGSGCFVGGFVGAETLQANYLPKQGTQGSFPVIPNKSLSGVSEVRGKYYVGGFCGAAILPTKPSNATTDVEDGVDVDDYRVTNDKMTVTADGAVCGGYYGYYEVKNDTNWENTDRLEKLKNCANAYGENPDTMIQELDALMASMNVCEYGYESNTYRVPSNKNNSDKIRNNMNIDILSDYVKVGYVKAGYLAGGLFGYVPDSLSIRISFTNKNKVETTLDGDNLIDGKFSYAGGIVGKVGRKMLLEDCSNEGLTISNSKYYGALTEQNLGTIRGSFKEGFGLEIGNAVMVTAESENQNIGYKGSPTYVGGLCGVNEQTGVLTGVIRAKVGDDGKAHVSGPAYVGGLCGKNAGTIEVNELYQYRLTISSVSGAAGGICGLNTGEIKTTDNGGIEGDLGPAKPTITGAYAGLIAGENGAEQWSGTVKKGKITGIIMSDEAKAAINGTEATGTFAGKNSGIISGCHNNKKLENSTGVAGGIAGVAEGESEILDSSNMASITAQDDKAAGIVYSLPSGTETDKCRNYGNVKYGICASCEGTITNCLDACGSSNPTSILEGAEAASHNYYFIDAAQAAEAELISTSDPRRIYEGNDEIYTASFAGTYHLMLYKQVEGEENAVIKEADVSLTEAEYPLTPDSIFALLDEAVPEDEFLHTPDPETGFTSDDGYYLVISNPEYHADESTAACTPLVAREEGATYTVYAWMDNQLYIMGLTGYDNDPRTLCEIELLADRSEAIRAVDEKLYGTDKSKLFQ